MDTRFDDSQMKGMRNTGDMDKGLYVYNWIELWGNVSIIPDFNMIVQSLLWRSFAQQLGPGLEGLLVVYKSSCSRTNRPVGCLMLRGSRKPKQW